jgi:glycerol-3-phosphate acyltransferase PlsX
LLDVGANVVCQSRNLQDFAYLGSKFAQVLLGKNNPTVGLLNIGKELTKGTDLIKSTHELLQDCALNYVGFVEANALLTGDVDVVVADGFSGNVALKAMEGAGSFCLRSLKKAAADSIISKLGLALFKLFAGKSISSLDPNSYNGGVFLGLNGIVVKSHGAANVRAFKTCINHAITMSRGDLIGKLKQDRSLIDD